MATGIFTPLVHACDEHVPHLPEKFPTLKEAGAYKPEYQVRLKWRPGTVAFWDNLQVLHYAVNDYHGQRRIMQRISVAGIPLDDAGCTDAANTSRAG
ncbi:TauD/TfdA family dioxygenase [Sphingomonas sp. ZT3P38]|uniref:TauD/TfdA dioxygenase family protein n=1 Tax=Parasphingomonas zepuensis TaxID=3096161 RepID=UPI002FC7C902